MPIASPSAPASVRSSWPEAHAFSIPGRAGARAHGLLQRGRHSRQPTRGLTRVRRDRAVGVVLLETRRAIVEFLGGRLAP